MLVTLRLYGTVISAPTGKRLAPQTGELVLTLRWFGELEVSDALAAHMVHGQGAGTITDRIAV